MIAEAGPWMIKAGRRSRVLAIADRPAVNGTLADLHPELEGAKLVAEIIDPAGMRCADELAAEQRHQDPVVRDGDRHPQGEEHATGQVGDEECAGIEICRER
jgi:hypothetical protein